MEARKSLKKDNQRTLVVEHTEGGNLAALKWMKSKNYSFDVLSGNDLTPLMIAAKRGYEEIVLWLLSTDVDLNKENKSGDTAYSIALQMDTKTLLIILQKLLLV